MPADAGPLPLPDGRTVLPDNRTDLLAGHHPDPPPTVSVVVPYYRDQRRLDLVLTGLSLQTHPASRLQVVVADDGSPQPPVLGALVPGVDRVVVRQADRGFRAAAARNLGAAAGEGTVLCFLDGDTVPEPAYVTRLTRLPALAPDAVTTGRRRHADLTRVDPAHLTRWLRDGVDPPPELGEPGWLADLHRRTGDLARLEDRSYEAVISAVLAVSVELFAELGGFDESFTAYGGEDWEWGFRALNAGALLSHEPAAVAWHDGPDWGARTAAEPARAAAEKAVETAHLQARVPGIATDRSGPPAVAVTVDAPPPDRAAAVAACRAAGLDAVLVPPGDLGPATLLLALAGSGAPPPPAGLAALVAEVGPGAHARVVDRVGGWDVRVTRIAALRRAARWATAFPGQDLIDRLYQTADRGRP